MRFGLPVRVGAVLTFAAVTVGCGGGGGGSSQGSLAQDGNVVSTRSIEGLEFTATSKAVYTTSEPITVTLTVKNPTSASVSFTHYICGAGQLPSASVRNENGVVGMALVQYGGIADVCLANPITDTFAPGQTASYTLVWNRRDDPQAEDDRFSIPSLPGTYKVSPVVRYLSIGGRQFPQTGSDANGNPYPAIGPDPLTVTVR